MSDKAVRAHRFEVVGFSGDNRKRWWNLCDAVRQMTNLYWREWEAYHTQHGTPQVMRQFASDLAAYRKKERTEKPSLLVQAVPKQLAQRIYKMTCETFPEVHNRVASLCHQAVRKKMTGKDCEGRWQLWQSILMDRQGRPNARHPQPIPFDSRSAEIIQGEKGFELRIRLTRLPSDKKSCPSIEDSCRLKARGNGAAILRRVLSGEYKFCGSSLTYDDGKRKWYANVAYQMPVTEHQAGAGRAVFFPSKAYPFVLMIDGKSMPLERMAGHTEHVRKLVMTNRWSRKTGYKYGSSARKGRGRTRAMLPVEKLSERWRNYVKTANHQVSKEAVDTCFQRGVGELVFMQPLGEKAKGRMIANVGKVENCPDKTAWDFAQLKTMLAYKCQDLGIKFEVKQYGGESSVAAVA